MEQQPAKKEGIIKMSNQIKEEEAVEEENHRRKITIHWMATAALKNKDLNYGRCKLRL